MKTQTSARPVTVSDNPNCVQSSPNFAKPPGRYLQAGGSAVCNKLENRTLYKILTVLRDIKIKEMKKILFALICGCLMSAVTISIRAQGEESNLEMRKYALSRVTDQSVLKQIALDDKENAEMRRYALSRVSDQSTFIQIALDSGENVEMRRYALSRVSDQNVFKQIALNEEIDAETRMYALSRVTDQNVFKQIALDEKDIENKK